MARSQLDFTMVDLAKLYPAATPETCRPALPRPRAHRGTNGGQVLDRRRCHRVALQQFDDVTGPSASSRPPRPRRRTATPASASLQLGAPPVASWRSRYSCLFSDPRRARSGYYLLPRTLSWLSNTCEQDAQAARPSSARTMRQRGGLRLPRRMTLTLGRWARSHPPGLQGPQLRRPPLALPYR